MALGHGLGSLTTYFLGPYYGYERILPLALICSIIVAALMITAFTLHARAKAAANPQTPPDIIPG